MARVFGRHLDAVRVSGTKPLYGHPLGASGAIESAIVALALHHGFLPATLNHHQASPDSPEARLTLVPPGGANVQAGVAVSNSFGFGGTNASLVFRRWTG
jgi:3-oxoacyl-[acyl-carrier-protein] synthase II